uniref:Putative kazalzinho kazal type serine protease inhibitor n=1 Tax=Triatoma infestans TaxID=30076 RepID=A0A023F6M3_TRIIF
MKLYLTILAIIIIINAGVAVPAKTNCARMMCPLIWTPVCATNGTLTTTFPNDCELKRTNCFAHTPFKVLKRNKC